MTKARTLADNFAADINGITAGTGITGGGTSGTVTVTNEMATTITAKGDLLAGTGNAAFDNLAAGASGETLVADSSATTGLRWQGNYAAGKNKIINGDFGVWQRGTSFTNPATNAYTADRFVFLKTATSTTNITQETFTPGTAPVAGYEDKFYLRADITSFTSGLVIVSQNIEDVRTFAGQTVTVSFWAKSSTPITNTVVWVQNFGSGGSTSVNATSTVSLTTDWVRYSKTFTLPSIAGKTIGANSKLEFQVLRVSSAVTLDLWGVQVEAGSVATAFQTATGTLAGELAACQRYYQRMSATANGNSFANGNNESTTIAVTHIPFKVNMRIAPTALEQSGTAADYKLQHQATTTTCSSVPLFANATPFAADVSFTVASGLTAGNGCKAVALTGNAYLGWSAEL